MIILFVALGLVAIDECWGKQLMTNHSWHWLNKLLGDI